MFEDIKVSSQFRNSITTALHSGTLSHALILEGADAETRLLAAKEIAKAVLCEGDNKPCGSCTKCKKVEGNIHPDVHLLEKDEKSSMIKVEAIRELKKKAGVLPNDGKKSVFIVNSAELMNPQAQNALLKIFEEPSPHLLFILCCTAKSSLLDTIISRATAYSVAEEKFLPVNDEKNEKARLTSNELCLCLIGENEIEFLKKIAPMQKDKDLFRAVLRSMKLIFRDSIVLRHGGKEMISEFPDTSKKISSRLTAQKLFEISATLDELYDISMMNSNHNLTLTRFSSLLYNAKNS